MRMLNILGTQYEIIKKDYHEEPNFERGKIDGFCDTLLKQIVYCNMKTHIGWEGIGEDACRYQEALTLRHEIIHAFLFESGLGPNSSTSEDGWAINEEMVDWFSIQGQKIYFAWNQVGILDLN